MFSCVLLNKCEISKCIELSHGVLSPNQYIYSITPTPKAQGTSCDRKTAKVRKPAARLSSVYAREVSSINLNNRATEQTHMVAAPVDVPIRVAEISLSLSQKSDRQLMTAERGRISNWSPNTRWSAPRNSYI